MYQKLPAFLLFILCISYSTSHAQCPATITATGPTALCQYDQSLTLTANSGTSYVWYEAGVYNGVNTQTFVPPNNIPGTHDYSVLVWNGNCSDTAYIQVTVMPAPVTPVITASTPVCYGDNLYLAANNLSGVTYQWTGPAGYMSTLQNPVIINAQWFNQAYYYLTVTDNLFGCTSLPDSVWVQVDSCLVWPGDANSDLTADNNDVLDLALAYGQTGPVRSGATINWVGEMSASWGMLQTCGAEMKHADCNGDGIVDIDDTLAIYNNYGMIHNKGGHFPQAKVTANPDLYFDLSNVSMQAGTTVSVPVMLGTSALPVNDIYGLAANISIDGITPANMLAISNSTSWIGNMASTIHFTKDHGTTGIDWTLARIDHTNTSGDGQIGTLTFDIPANATGNVELYFNNVKMVRADGTTITDYNVVFDTAAVMPVSVGAVATPLQAVAVVPNPSQSAAQVQVSLASDAQLSITVTDVTGKAVWQHSANGKAGTQQIALPGDKLAAGIYIIELHNSLTSGKQSLKWVKN